MQVSYDALIAQPVDVVWQSLTDVDNVLAALPAAALARDGDAVRGSLKCKLGSTQITYRIAARADAGEPDFRTAVVTVSGAEARGAGTITAELTVSLRSAAPDTRIEISGDIVATGRGASADAVAWQRVIKALVDSAAPRDTTASVPTTAPEVVPRPALSVAPDPVAGARPAVPLLPIAAGAAALLAVIFIARRWKATRR